MPDHLGTFVGALGSPIVGVIAGVVFATEKCTSIPGVRSGVLTYSPTQYCGDKFNEEIGMVLTLIGWSITGVWFLYTLWRENQGRQA